ncbi:hypothetical protein QMK33_00230 [Hymenobacter sp. H14-R3]|uniref:hypothetical protein n=1 Tax=Hymenobacter sp. H14-R3 TaxID=3046308 RepID=UPI0024B9E29B|nr:hypothetical protein [Hymenobacter sp. H14-R3]MDJ0363560.1 hypothetical protein [Hymenobacter sp. H14-R3]
MALSRYDFDLANLVKGLKPYLLRKPRFLTLTNAVLVPLAEVHFTFLAYTRKVKTQLSYNGQTMAFERALNDLFDPVLARIRILDSLVDVSGSYDNFVAEQQPWQYMTFFQEQPPYEYDYNFTELLNQVGFIVQVPASLQPKEAALRARIRQLKLAMVKYRIQYI